MASVKYSNDLSETYAHLTNHCIQEKHPEFGLLSKSNEIFFDQLDAYLREFTNWNVADHLIPQIESIVNLSLNSVKEVCLKMTFFIHLDDWRFNKLQSISAIRL